MSKLVKYRGGEIASRILLCHCISIDDINNLISTNYILLMRNEYLLDTADFCLQLLSNDNYLVVQIDREFIYTLMPQFSQISINYGQSLITHKPECYDTRRLYITEKCREYVIRLGDCIHCCTHSEITWDEPFVYNRSMVIKLCVKIADIGNQFNCRSLINNKDLLSFFNH